MHDVYVWGDSHWRVFFPSVNHGSPGVVYERDGIRVIDMVANELSGATMYGLLNDNSKNGARKRILQDLKYLNKRAPNVDNIAFVFGEVDVRYHNHHYFQSGGWVIDSNAVDNLLLRYREFIQSLFDLELVKKNVFVYYGFAYPKGEATLLQPGIEMGSTVHRARILHEVIAERLPAALADLQFGDVHTVIAQHDKTGAMVSSDGVHLDPTQTYRLTHSLMREVLL